jgi:hypothetical protein
MHQAELAERSGFNKKKEIRAADDEIDSMELLIENLYAEQGQLKQTLEAEIQFYQEKDDEINSNL